MSLLSHGNITTTSGVKEMSLPN